MLLSRKEIDKEVHKLELLVPRMLERAGSATVWAEFFERANRIKARVSPDQKDLVWEKVCELLSKSNLSPLRQNASSNGATTGRVYAFPTGLRLS
ncbi:hypothetical protein [Dyella silvae]|uniref:hypothetical protein n=1 Tax=Dyella silvae TaxID=2994424 RepID=UPI0022647295|nr:hypothetical protein [Dyella silvae]